MAWVNHSQSWYISSRASALAELFLRDLGADLSIKTRSPRTADYYLQFGHDKNAKMILVEVHASRLPVNQVYHFPAPRPGLKRMIESKRSLLILVAEVVEERLFYCWARELRPTESGSFSVHLKAASASSAREVRRCVMSGIEGNPFDLEELNRISVQNSQV